MHLIIIFVSFLLISACTQLSFEVDETDNHYRQVAGSAMTTSMLANKLIPLSDPQLNQASASDEDKPNIPRDFSCKEDIFYCGDVFDSEGYCLVLSHSIEGIIHIEKPYLEGTEIELSITCEEDCNQYDFCLGLGSSSNAIDPPNVNLYLIQSPASKPLPKAKEVTYRFDIQKAIDLVLDWNGLESAPIRFGIYAPPFFSYVLYEDEYKETIDFSCKQGSCDSTGKCKSDLRCSDRKFSLYFSIGSIFQM